MPSLKKNRSKSPTGRLPLSLHGENRSGQTLYALRRTLRQPGIVTALLVLPIAVAVCMTPLLVSLETVEENLHKRWSEAVAWAEDNTPVRVELVSVEGLVRTAPAEVEAALDLPREMSPFSINIGDWRDSLERLPWVAEAAVRYVPMGSVSVRVTEHEPVAVWLRDDGHWLVNETGGHIITAEGAHLDSLPQMTGEGADAAVGELIMLRASHPELDELGAVYRRIGRRRWNVELANGQLAMLPERNIELAAARLRDLLGQWVLDERKVTVIDLRNPERIAVRLVGDELERLLDGESRLFQGTKPGVEL